MIFIMAQDWFRNMMREEFNNYLYKFWLEHYSDICKYCKNKIECKEEKCPKYENYGNKGYFVHPDGTQSEEQIFTYDTTCMDLDYGDCPLMEDSPCHNCFENSNSNFVWNEVIPDDFDSI